ncbi:MAG TPA: fibronectin type III domain-containing protein, partial [Candidatus Woesebacteria bacterium]|nr:fibronectin type III domain-containing protein [Candidatus Woesebacteria bacterium]
MTPTPTPTGEITPTPTPTDEMTPTPTPTGEITPTPTPTPTPSTSVTPSLTPTPTISSTDGGGGGQTGTTTGTVAGVSTTAASPWVCSDAKPGSITNFRVTSVGLNTVSLAWNSASLANDYGLFFTNLGTGTTYGASSLGNTTSYVINGVTTGLYQFEVFPINGCMPGDRVSLTQFIEGVVLVTRPVGPEGEVLGEETNVEKEIVQEIMGGIEKSGEVAGVSTSCTSSRLFLPWILLITQLGLMLAVEILMKKGKSFHKLIMIGVITALSIILFYLLRDCHCYEVKSFLSWLCVWYWLISVLETLLTRLFAYGFIEVVKKD